MLSLEMTKRQSIILLSALHYFFGERPKNFFEKQVEARELREKLEHLIITAFQDDIPSLEQITEEVKMHYSRLSNFTYIRSENDDD